MKIAHWTKPTRHKDTRKIGARAIVVPDNDHGWPAKYEIDTHGMSPNDVDAALEAIEVKHEKWARRISGFAAVLGVELSIGDSVFRVMDCTIPSNSKKVIVGVRRIAGEKLVPVEGFPTVIPFAVIDGAPSNEEILSEVRRMLEDIVVMRVAHDAFAAKVKAARIGGVR